MGVGSMAKRNLVHGSHPDFEHVKIDTLKLHPANPRRGNIPAIVESMRVHGFYGVVVAQRSTRYVLAGNHRLRAARELKIETVPVRWIDCDDIEAKRILLVDNKTNDLAVYDDDELLALLREFDSTTAALV